MKIARLTQNYEDITLLKQLGIVIPEEKKYYLCKKCGHKNNFEEIEVVNDFWQCVDCDRKSKNNPNQVKTEVYYHIQLNELYSKLADKIKRSGFTTENNNNLCIKLNGGLFPIFALEFPERISTLIDSLQRASLLVYFLELSKTNLENIYSKPQFIKVSDFFKLGDIELKKKIDNIILHLEKSEIFEYKRKLSDFCKNKGWQAFEKEIARFLNDLKVHEKEIRDMLSFFQKNKNNPSGTKFVHIGGNFPADVYAISLFDYFNGLLEVFNNKSYDAKQLSNKLPKSVIDEKCRTNKGRELVFITNQDASSGAWEEMIKAKEQASGWYHFIIDEDLLIILMYFVKSNDYFN